MVMVVVDGTRSLVLGLVDKRKTKKKHPTVSRAPVLESLTSPLSSSRRGYEPGLKTRRERVLSPPVSSTPRKRKGRTMTRAQGLETRCVFFFPFFFCLLNLILDYAYCLPPPSPSRTTSEGSKRIHDTFWAPVRILDATKREGRSKTRAQGLETR